MPEPITLEDLLSTGLFYRQETLRTPGREQIGQDYSGTGRVTYYVDVADISEFAQVPMPVGYQPVHNARGQLIAYQPTQEGQPWISAARPGTGDFLGTGIPIGQVFGGLVGLASGNPLIGAGVGALTDQFVGEGNTQSTIGSALAGGAAGYFSPGVEALAGAPAVAGAGAGAAEAGAYDIGAGMLAGETVTGVPVANIVGGGTAGGIGAGGVVGGGLTAGEIAQGALAAGEVAEQAGALDSGGAPVAETGGYQPTTTTGEVLSGDFSVFENLFEGDFAGALDSLGISADQFMSNPGAYVGDLLQTGLITFRNEVRDAFDGSDEGGSSATDYIGQLIGALGGLGGGGGVGKSVQTPSTGPLLTGDPNIAPAFINPVAGAQHPPSPYNPTAFGAQQQQPGYLQALAGALQPPQRKPYG